MMPALYWRSRASYHGINPRQDECSSAYKIKQALNECLLLMVAYPTRRLLYRYRPLVKANATPGRFFAKVLQHRFYVGIKIVHIIVVNNHHAVFWDFIQQV